MLKQLMLAGSIISIMVLGGCDQWQKKYKACNADLENLQALYDSAREQASQAELCQADNARLNQQITALTQQLKNQPKHVPGGLEREGGQFDPARGTVTLTLANDVLFDSGRVSLKSGSKSQLARVADIIQQEHPGQEVWVIGHTDTDPIKKSKWVDNWQLSTERALAVTRYLKEQGVSAKNLVAAGRSEYHPVSKNKVDNRRVEIVVFTR